MNSFRGDLLADSISDRPTCRDERQAVNASKDCKGDNQTYVVGDGSYADREHEL